MYRRQYTLQQNTETGWINILSAQQHVSKQYVLGFAKGMRQYTPCPELRMIDHQTGEVLEQWEKKTIIHPSRQYVQLGVEGDQPYFKIDNQTFFVGSEPEEPFWYVDMMRKAFEKLGVEIK